MRFLNTGQRQRETLVLWTLHEHNIRVPTDLESQGIEEVRTSPGILLLVVEKQHLL